MNKGEKMGSSESRDGRWGGVGSGDHSMMGPPIMMGTLKFHSFDGRLLVDFYDIQLKPPCPITPKQANQQLQCVSE